MLKTCFLHCLKNLNLDSVIRCGYNKYFHPKEDLVNGPAILNRGVKKVLQELWTTNTHANEGINESSGSKSADKFSFVYPYGASLDMGKRAVGAFSSGSSSFPANRPVVGFWLGGVTRKTASASSTGGDLQWKDRNKKNEPDQEKKSDEGRVVVIGSSHVFHDQYLEKEDNATLRDIILVFLTQPSFPINWVDAETHEGSAEKCSAPDLQLLSEQPLGCLQESEEVAWDHMQLFPTAKYSIKNTKLAPLLTVYQELGMEPQALKLIKAHFQAPLPPLTPATFPPTFRESAKPALELFDLDSQLSSSQERLLKTADKCSDKDLDYFIRQSALILDVGRPITKMMTDKSQVAPASQSSNKILHEILLKLIEYKKVNSTYGEK